ncbi:hypothetical protein [Streptomyces sp. SLBN-8D4]|uniref:hypothetical protein n=1 Tax=Streptomyces sp. SLBN-8D4 TaxID=3377728 RepID=UPI003C7C84FF
MTETGSVSTPLAIVLGLNLLALSFIAGYIFRGLAFWLIGLIEKIPDSDTFMAQLKQTCGERSIDDCLQAHPQLAHYLRASDPGGLNAGPHHGGGHRNHHRLQALNYCKDRLREKSPMLAVDNNEAEINILTSCLFPVLFISADIIWIGDFPLPVNLLVSFSCAGTWVGLLRSTLRLRTTESVSAVINLSYTVGAQQPPSPPIPITN